MNTNKTNYLEIEAGKLAMFMRPKHDGVYSEEEIIAIAEELALTVKKYALGAAAAGIGSAWIPGVGGLISTGAVVTFIWSMYFKINKCLGIEFSKAAVKTLASAVLSNLTQAAAAIVGTVAVATVLSLTGLGAIPATLMLAAMDYAVVSVGGVIYLKLLNGLMREGRSLENVNEEELPPAVTGIIDSMNIREMLKAESENYKRGRRNGSISGKETAEVFD